MKNPHTPSLSTPIVQLNSLGARLTAIAAKMGGKRALALATGISEAQVFRYVNGESEMPAHKLFAIAHAAGVSAEWLLHGTGTSQPAVAKKRPDFNPALMQQLSQNLDEVLIEYAQRVPLRQKSRFLAFMYECARHEEIRSGQPWPGGRGLMLNMLDFLCGLHDEESLQLYERFAYHQMFGPEISGCTALKPNEQDSLGQSITQAVSHFFSGNSGETVYRRLTMKIRPATAQRLTTMIAETRQSLGLLPHKPLNLLDLGCGNGRDLLFLHRLDPTLKLSGLELSERGVRLVQNLEKATQLPAGTVAQGDAQLLPFATASFELVTSRGSLMTLPLLYPESTHGWHAMLRECHRVLKPGGRFYLNTATGSGQIFLPFAQLLTPEELAAMATACGFELARSQPYNQREEQQAAGEHTANIPDWVEQQSEYLLIKR